MNRYEWRKYLDEVFPDRRETITVLQLGRMLDKSNQAAIEKGIREGIYPGKAIFNKATGRFKYIIHKWQVAAWLAAQGQMVVGD